MRVSSVLMTGKLRIHTTILHFHTPPPNLGYNFVRSIDVEFAVRCTIREVARFCMVTRAEVSRAL